VVHDDEAGLLGGAFRVVPGLALVVARFVLRRAGLSGRRLPRVVGARLGLDLASARRDDPGAARQRRELLQLALTQDGGGGEGLAPLRDGGV
jgi:hypothetical protein